MAFLDLKALNLALDELQGDRGISRDSVVQAIATALATAYRREYGKKGQIIRCTFDPQTGDMEFKQAKIVVDESLVYDAEKELERAEDDHRSRFNPEQHIMIDDARRIKKDVQLDEEVTFPLRHAKISAALRLKLQSR